MTVRTELHGISIGFRAVADPIDNVEDFQGRIGALPQQPIPARLRRSFVPTAIENPGTHDSHMVGVIPECPAY